MINTKGLLIGGGAALVAAYLLLSAPGADGNGGLAEGGIRERAGGILGTPTTGTEGGATPQNMYSFPAETFAGFPAQQEGFDLGAWFAGLTGDEVPDERQDIPAAARPDYAAYEAAYAATEAIAYGDSAGRAYRPTIVSPLAAPGAAKKDITRAIGGAGRAISGAGVAGGGAVGAAVRDIPKAPAHVAKSGSAMGRAFSGLFGSVAAAATGTKKDTMVQPSAAQTRAEAEYQKSAAIAYSSGGHVVPGVSYYSPGAVSKGATPTSRQALASKAGVTDKPPATMTKKAWSAHLAGGD